MKNITKINKAIGWTLTVGIIITQLIIIKVTLDIGRMTPFLILLSLIIFLPIIITARVSIYDRKKQLHRIKNGIKASILFQVILPIVLPLSFDKEFIYLSLFGLFLGFLMWYFKKKVEVQLLILNGIGIVIWILISLATTVSF